jgi:hypothetical protein
MTHWQGGSQVARKEKVRKGKLKTNNSSTITTHIYVSRTGNSERMDREKWGDRKGTNTSSIVDRVHHVSQLIPTSD